MSGIGEMQRAALAIGSRVRTHEDAGAGNYNASIYGPTGRKMATFIVANAASQEDAERIVKLQVSFKVIKA